ncbi:MAG TPA: HemK family protein methyltransferase [bacterium]|nr:HemK family protein methyltransferase [bacterium]
MPFNYPDAYLAGRTEFMQLDFHTDPRALIPRLETEVLVKEAGRLLQERVPDLIIDTGTGTGIIPITLAKRYGYANALIATDIDPDALGLAAENAILHDVGVELIQCDLLDSPELRQAISGVGSVLFVANLPYVPERDANLVSADTVYEPRHALYAGEDGYDCIAVYLEQFRGLIETHPNMSIALIMEMDPSHTDRTLSVLSDLGTAEPFADYAGDIRFVRFTRLWKN